MRVVLLVVILLFPFLIMLSVSIKSTAETIAYPPTVIPKTWTFQHFIDIFDPGIFPYLKYFGNSLYIALTVSVLAVFLGILGGYALSKLKFKGKKGISEMFFLVYMFSGILLIVPLFRMLSAIGLLRYIRNPASRPDLWTGSSRSAGGHFRRLRTEPR